MQLMATIFFLACTPQALVDFAFSKWQADKALRIEDVYKWTYQATRGGEHAAPDREAAAAWLDREWKKLDAMTAPEPEWEPLCGEDGEIGRFNLRPYKARGGSQAALVNAFLASAAEYRSESAAFTAAWAAVGKKIKEKSFNAINYDEWLRLDRQMSEKGYPAIHHSDPYNKERRPAYRVLTAAQFLSLSK